MGTRVSLSVHRTPMRNANTGPTSPKDANRESTHSTDLREKHNNVQHRTANNPTHPTTRTCRTSTAASRQGRRVLGWAIAGADGGDNDVHAQSNTSRSFARSLGVLSHAS